jgi:hypothetical protein
MSSTPFRFIQRRTLTSGKVPVITGLLTGEIYLQAADGTIYFRDAYQEKLHTVITDASGFGLNKIKFSGANSGDFPVWDGFKFSPSPISGLSYIGSGSGLNSLQQGGSNNISSGNYSVTLGSGNLAQKDFSFALGKQAKTSQFGEFAFSNGSFSEEGDSQYSFLMARAVTTSSTPTLLKINNSDKIVELELGSTIFFTANVVGAGGDKYVSNEIRGVIKRSKAKGSIISFLNAPSKSLYALYPNGSNFSVNVKISESDNSLKIECVGDATEKMIWFAKIDLIKIIESKNVYFNPTPTDNWFDLSNWYSDKNYSQPSPLPDDESIAYINSININSQPYVNIDNPSWVTPEIINTKNIANTSGLKIISNSGAEFFGTIIGNVTFDGANPISITDDLYFSGSINNNWYDANNWFVTNSFKTKASSIPKAINRAYMYGSDPAYVSIDSPSWITPQLINTQNVSHPSGVYIVSSLGNDFTGVVIGTSTFSGVNVVSVNQNLYFSGSINNNWYNIDNWFATNTFKTKSTSLPSYGNEARMFTLACIDIDDVNWKTPKLIDTTSVVNASGIYITSNLQKEFTGIISGNSSFSGVSVVNITDFLYFSGASNNNWYDINNWFITDRFKTQSLSLPSYNNTTCMYGSIPAYVSIDNADWKTPKLIDTRSVTHPSGICIVSLVNNSFTGIISGNSSFSGVNVN